MSPTVVGLVMFTNRRYHEVQCEFHVSAT